MSEVRPIFLDTHRDLLNPAFRWHYYNAIEEAERRAWRLHIGILGVFFDWLTFGWYARNILKRPRPTAGDIDALVNDWARRDAAMRGENCSDMPTDDAKAD